MKKEVLQKGSINCGILPSRMHGKTRRKVEEHQIIENLENMKNVKDLNTLWMIKNTRWMIQSTLFMTQNALFANKMTQNTLFYGIQRESWKIIICVLGEHFCGSVQNWRTSSHLWRPDDKRLFGKALYENCLIAGGMLDWLVPSSV